MEIPIFRVDFNEMLEPNLVLLSRGDTREDLNGRPVDLRDGLEICVVMQDIDEQDQPDDLLAFGAVERNSNAGWATHVKWCCRIDERGIRHRSEIE
jgi:hypothetical protein